MPRGGATRELVVTSQKHLVTSSSVRWLERLDSVHKFALSWRGTSILGRTTNQVALPLGESIGTACASLRSRRSQRERCRQCGGSPYYIGDTYVSNSVIPASLGCDIVWCHDVSANHSLGRPSRRTEYGGLAGAVTYRKPLAQDSCCCTERSRFRRRTR